MKRLIIFLFLQTLLLTSFAQKFSFFSDNKELTIEEMKSFLSEVPKEKQKEADKLLDEFTKFWLESGATEENQDAFIEISNQMLKRKMRPFPQFNAFIHAHIQFCQSELSESNKEWIAIMKYHIANDAQRFHIKMKQYEDFFGHLYLNNDQNSRWTLYGLPEEMGMEQEPYILLKDVDLVGASKNDSITILGTSGKFFPATQTFKGEKGEINWERAGMFDVNAKFGAFILDVRFPNLTVENAKLTYPELFSYPLEGRVEDKATIAVEPEKMSYPRFKSYDNKIPIKEIYRNVDYLGGIELLGASIQGSTGEEELAQLTIKKKGKQIVGVESKSYLFRADGVLANDARVKIFVEEDSIYHPAANMKFTESTQELLVTRPKLGVGRAPFFDSYHRMDITAESISWKTEEERIEFKPLVGSTNYSSAFFESQNYYEESVMRKIQGYNDESPLLTLFKAYKSHQFQPLPLRVIVSHFRRSENDIKNLLIDFAARGFVEYDVINDRIHYRPKIMQYLNNEIGQQDYDNIVLESKDHYAAFDLTNFELRVTGCEFFVLSDAQIVNVYPTNEKVTVKKNRDMNFSGRIIAGLFDFVASNCVFTYDKFEVEMNVIDSMIMSVEDPNGRMNVYGERELRRVNSTIEELAGTLYIDAPNNKSGRIDFPEFPIFESRKGGKVFYDQPYVLGGVYKRDRFYFYVDIFRIENLDNFVIDSLSFNGHLVSGGIFPDIHEPLRVQPDFSLGFHHVTPDDGIPMYNGLGKYTSEIDLSNRGLRGKGTIDFMTSTTVSDSLVFFMDSTNGSIKRHDVAPKETAVEFPIAYTTDAYLHWTPYLDKMHIQTLENPVNIFEETDLVGESIITSQGMLGVGVLTFKRADLTSKLFKFKHHELHADTADLRIFSLEDNTDFAFQTSNYKSHIDFKTRIGDFVSNGEGSEVFFIKNEFKAKAKAFEWNTIDENILKFRWDEDPYKDINIDATPSRELVDMISQGNELISTDDGMRGLQFCATAAEFDFGKNIINAHGVRFVPVGDAAIIPEKGDVTILEEAQIEPLKNSRILAGRYNKFHEIYNCNTKIHTGIDFRSSGDIDYIDENDMKTVLHLDTIWFYQTTQAIGTIPAEREFMLSPHFGFDGRIEVTSVDTFIHFVGGVELIHDCDSIKRPRMKIMQQVNPKSIYLEVHNRTKDVTDRKVVVAIASENKTGRIYTAFGTAKDQFNDAEYISVFGYITYNHATQEFWAASMDKLKDPSLPGNMLRLNKFDCITVGTGAVDMGAKLGRIKFNTNGSVTNYMKADSAEMNLTTSIDFFFNEDAMKSMSFHLTNASDLDYIDPSEDEGYQAALLNILGEEGYERYEKNADAFGQVRRLPTEMQVQFLFASINFSWDKETSAFISQENLPIIISGKKQIYKYVPGKLVIEKRSSRNRLYLYLEADNEFYFFQFENNSMYGFASDKKFVEAIRSVKAKHRSLKPEKGLPSFSYKLGNKSQHRKFINKYYHPEEEEEVTD